MHAAQNYIYIVFVILYIIYSIVKAVKKASGQNPETKMPEPASTVRPPATPPVPNTGDAMKKMLEDLLGVPRENAPDQQAPQTKSQPVPVKSPVRQKAASLSSARPAQNVRQPLKEKGSVLHIPAKTRHAAAKSFLVGEELTSPEKKLTVPAVEEEPASDTYRE